jgi:phosphoenolpyruvate carboxylase
MYTNWPFFREMVDLIAMTLSKTDYSISTNYEMQLVDSNDKELKQLGDELREKLIRARKSVLTITGCEDLSSGFLLLRQSMKVRNPFVDPLNVLQAEMMKRLRYLTSCSIAATGSDSAGGSASAASLSSDEFEFCLEEEVERQLEHKHIMEDALVISINGVAQGMKNSG